MAPSQILGTVGGFIFNPAATIATHASKPRFARHAMSFLIVTGISMLQGIAAFYMIFYPEPLYYGLGPDTPHAHLFIIEQSNPMLLAGLVILLLLINGFFFLCIGGSINFGLLKLLARGRGETPTYRDFIAGSACAFMPLLFTIPLAAFRYFFFGRITFGNHDFPFFDLTVPNFIYVLLLGAIYAWMFVVQAKINRAMFDGLGWRASIPPIVVALLTIALLAVIAVVLPPVLNDVVYTIIDE
ncbi:MAG: hypothetical protein Q6373_011940 [Candidatus Sigynarchaeota archaeon]